MKPLHDWLNEYGESHQNETNKTLHWICIPLIFFSIVGLLYSVKLPFHIPGNHQANLAFLVVLLVVLYYFLPLLPSMGMALFAGFCLWICHLLEGSGVAPLWMISLIIFVLAWVGQFFGHKVEGKKPSFLKDIQFLMIGPAWLMSFIYQKIGFKY